MSVLPCSTVPLARSRRSAALALLVTAAVSCGGSSPAATPAVSSDAPPIVTEPVATEPVATEPVVTEPVATEPVVTEPVVTEPVVTEPVTAEQPTWKTAIEGEWHLVERLISDDGYFLTDEEVVQALDVEITCADDVCSVGTYSESVRGEPVSSGTLTFDGTNLQSLTTELVACLNPSTGQYDGPLLSAVGRATVLTPDIVNGVLIGFSGPGSAREETAASAECSASTSGFEYEAVLHRTQAGLVIDRDDVFRGTETSVDGAERGIRLCTTGSCDALMRLGVNRMNDPAGALEYIDFALTLEPDGDYDGKSTYPGSCVSDIDGSLISLDAYDVTHSVSVRLNSVGTTRILETNENISGVPSTRITAAQAAVCAPYEATSTFIGGALERPEESRIDWVVEPLSSPA